MASHLQIVVIMQVKIHSPTSDPCATHLRIRCILLNYKTRVDIKPSHNCEISIRFVYNNR